MTDDLPQTYDETQESRAEQTEERAMSEPTETPAAEPSGAMSGPAPEEYDPIELYDLQRHRNGDETAIFLCSFGAGFQAFAMDVDAGGQILEIEQIGDEQDPETAKGMIKYWQQQNPEGVLGGVSEGNSFLEKLGFGGDGQ